MLTTTSYAILGQLAWGEATTYELVKAMGRNLRFIWPRAESRIYEEAKRLVDAGLAQARPGRTGRRRRTVYAITDEGRPEDLLAAVAATREHAEAMLAVGTPLAREYLDGAHPQQGEVHLRSLTFDYLYRWALFNRDWAERAEAELRRWRNTEPAPAKRRRALARIEAAVGGHDPV